MCGFSNSTGTVQTTVDPFQHEDWVKLVGKTREELNEAGEEMHIQILEMYAIYIAIQECPRLMNLRIVTDS